MENLCKFKEIATLKTVSQGAMVCDILVPKKSHNKKGTTFLYMHHQRWIQLSTVGTKSDIMFVGPTKCKSPFVFKSFLKLYFHFSEGLQFTNTVSVQTK